MIQTKYIKILFIILLLIFSGCVSNKQQNLGATHVNSKVENKITKDSYTIEQLKEALVKAHKAGDTQGASIIAKKIKSLQNQSSSEEFEQTISYQDIITKINDVNTKNKKSKNIKEFVKEYQYNISDDDSKNSARKKALNQVKVLILEEIGVFVESYLELNKIVTDEKYQQQFKQQIKNLTAGIIKTKILDETFDGKTYYVKVSVLVDPQSVTQGISEVLKIKANQDEINRLKVELEEYKTAKISKKEIKNINTYIESNKPIILIEDVNRQAEAWATCSAIYEFYAAINKNKPNTAKLFKQKSNGAKVAVVLSQILPTLDPDQFDYNVFSSTLNYAQFSAEEIPKVKMTAILSDMEILDNNIFLNKLSNTLNVCTENLEGQQMYIDIFREIAKQNILKFPESK